ncbi:hypothetical protein GMD78_17680 [Ornithinibacillus sp. L9]|uniref:Triacylglycerol lipase n=1 Tax=Ornithinibacillus caprae TaxID=2678566 RepID=A0A6N8FN50_9BACI|nr:hypothetical protein [Ornithinibacillus caprae]MUK90206.1 hypothetical protein [Ornithinibacillus caprae]
MHLGLKRLVFICFLLGFTFAICTTVSATTKQTSDIPDPQLVGKSDGISTMGKVGNGNDETPGEWYIGSAPSNPIPNAPVILFVPGLNNVAQIFWEDNDMYQSAVNAGYQTVFVQLYDAGGASADMWENGALLAEKINEISNHFGKPITVVAYSKGGVDTQAALTYYDAWQHVDNVITLSSPHHGSQLADLAYSSSAGWLADLLGAQGEGTYAMQMGYMENFRDQTDDQSMAYYNDYYTLGGTNWGSVFSSTWFGGMYLSQYGSNDGVVTTASSSLPGGQQLAIGDWNHTSIRTGVTFPIFESYVMDNQQNSEESNNTVESVEMNSPTVNQWLNGGPLQKERKSAAIVTVENDVDHVSFHVMTSNKLSELRLIDPSGKEITQKITTIENEEGVFVGSFSHLLTVDQPMAGNWKVELVSDQDDAYVLLANYTTTPKLIRNEKLESKEKLEVTYQLEVDKSIIQEKTLKATYDITQSSNPKNRKTFTVSGKSDLSKQLVFDQANEVYNITIEVKGLTEAGKEFTRTIVDSVYVD